MRKSNLSGKFEGKKLDARVEKFQYREYRFKEYTPRWKRILSTAWINFLYQWKRSTGTKIVIGIAVFIELWLIWSIISIFQILNIDDTSIRIFLVNFTLGINTFLGGVIIPNPVTSGNSSQFTGFSFPLGFLSLLSVILLGAGLFSDDNQHHVVDLYLTKMDRIDYIISKYLALLIPSLLILALPPFITAVFGISATTSFSLIEVAWILFAQLIYQIGLCIFITSMILLASAYSSRRAYAGLLIFFLLFFLSFSTSMAMQSQGRLPSATISDVEWLVLIDPFLSLQVWGAFLFGHDKVILTSFKSTSLLQLNDGKGLEWWHPVIMLVLIMSASWILTAREILKKLEEVAF